MRHCKIVLLLAALSLSLSTRAHAADGNCTAGDKTARPDCAGAQAFFEQFQTALNANNRKAVVQLIHFPLNTSLSGKRVRIRSAEELLAHYDQIFDPGVRCAVHDAHTDDVWGNYQGFMVGHGAVWFDGVIPSNDKLGVNTPNYWLKYPFKVVTVNPAVANKACVPAS
jgi:hypothetical protein